MLKKIKKSLTQKKFEAMLVSEGEFDELKNQIKGFYFKVETEETNVFSLLEEILIVFSLFQDRNKRKINRMLHLYREDELISTHLMPLYLATQRLGRDCYKEDQDKSVVCNKTRVDELVSKETIFVYTDYYVHAPQPLEFILKQSESPTGIANESMVKEVEMVLPRL
jgi:hypothetical protein